MSSRRAALGALALTLVASCGYRPIREASGASGGVSVVAGGTAVAEPLALTEAVVGAKMALARDGALRDGFPRLVIEIVRLDERSSGILANGGDPRARGTVLALTGRAFVVDAPGAAPGFDTGDVTVAEPVAAGPDARSDALSRDEAVRALARRLGETLAMRMIGYPTPAGERL